MKKIKGKTKKTRMRYDEVGNVRGENKTEKGKTGETRYVRVCKKGKAEVNAEASHEEEWEN